MFEIEKNKRVILGIDYFTRKLYGKYVTSKASEKVLDFIDNVYKECRFKNVKRYGREFENTKFKEWIKNNILRHVFSVPFFHQSNGRVERVNRTIREAIKKTPGNVKTKCKRIIDNYNNTCHRGLGMSPNSTCKPENFENVKRTMRNIVNNLKVKYARKCMLAIRCC
jgi:hypothetical protein